MWFAPLERAHQSGYSSRSQFRFLRGKALFQISIQISMELEKVTILSRAFPPTAHVSLLFLTIYTKLVYFSHPSTWVFGAVSRRFMDTECWISLCLLILKVYRGRQIHERTLFSYFLIWHAPSSIVVLAE